MTGENIDPLHFANSNLNVFTIPFLTANGKIDVKVQDGVTCDFQNYKSFNSRDFVGWKSVEFKESPQTLTLKGFEHPGILSVNCVLYTKTRDGSDTYPIIFSSGQRTLSVETNWQNIVSLAIESNVIPVGIAQGDLS